MNKLIVIGVLIVATTAEAFGDAIVRMGLHHTAVPARVGLFLAGTALLFTYGLTLNLAPVEFGRVVGLYIALLFVMFQIVNFVTFHKTPTLPVLVGGALIVVGGVVVTFWDGPTQSG